MTNKSIKYLFSPPYRPSFEGLWESVVKNVKRHLYPSVGDNILIFEKFSTLRAQISGCLNSRPLFSESMDPHDPVALTSSHILIGQPISALPKDDLIAVPQNRLKYWDQVQQMVQYFWKRWSTEYLNTLHQRSKWRIVKKDVKVEDLVLIKDIAMPPSKWPLAKIMKTHPSTDGHVRVITLKTVNSILKRSISKIILYVDQRRGGC